MTLIALEDRSGLSAVSGRRPKPAGGSRRGLLTGVILSCALPFLTLVAWQVASTRGLISPLILPPPSEVLDTGLSMLSDGELLSALFVSFQRILIGFTLGSILGVVVGSAMGLSRAVEAYLGPTVRAICLVPTIAWLPLFMLLFGIGEGLKIAIIVKGCFQPLAMNTLAGIRSVSSRYHDVARVLELGRWGTLRKVIAPAILPHLFAGTRQALGQAWMVLVTAEMLASAEGIGYIMSWARLLLPLAGTLTGSVSAPAWERVSSRPEAEYMPVPAVHPPSVATTADWPDRLTAVVDSAAADVDGAAAAGGV